MCQEHQTPVAKVHHHCPSSYHHPYASCMVYLPTFGCFFTANVCNYSMEHMGHYKPAQGEPKGERFGFFCRRVSPHVFFRLPWAMDNSSHEYMEAQSGHGQCLKIWSTLSSLYTQNQTHQNSKHSKFQVPRFSVF